MQALSISNTSLKINASRATIYRLLDRNEFPQPIRLGRRISFIEAEVDEWLEARKSARDDVTP